MFKLRSVGQFLLRAALPLCALLLAFPIRSTATPQIVMVVPDTVAKANQTDGWLYVRMNTTGDPIAGFQFVLKSTRPDLVKFRFGPGTVDTTGTLIGGFEYFQVINRAGDSSEYWLRCIYDLPTIPGGHEPIPNQQGGIAAKIPFRTYTAPEQSVGWEAALVFDKPTDFSDPFGHSIGAYVCPEYDTTFWNCAEYIADSCASWVQVFDTTLGYDFMYIDTTNFGCLDTSIVIVADGSVTLNVDICDNNGSGTLNILDLNCLVNYCFGEFNPSACQTFNCNPNGIGIINILDVIYLVQYLFGNGPAPL